MQVPVHPSWLHDKSSPLENLPQHLAIPPPSTRTPSPPLSLDINVSKVGDVAVM